MICRFSVSPFGATRLLHALIPRLRAAVYSRSRPRYSLRMISSISSGFLAAVCQPHLYNGMQPPVKTPYGRLMLVAKMALGQVDIVGLQGKLVVDVYKRQALRGTASA